MMTAANTILGWSTKKEADGTFTAKVTEMAHVYNAEGKYVGNTTGTVKITKGWKTRAQAKGNAIAWMRYARAQINKAAA